MNFGITTHADKLVVCLSLVLFRTRIFKYEDLRLFPDQLRIIVLFDLVTLAVKQMQQRTQINIIDH